jgi:peptide/nickel transport system substrate-binding protein
MRPFTGWGATALVLAGTLLFTPAHAQKQGGILKSYIWDTPPSASIHEEATISTVFPFMPVFNNLVLFDQTKLEANLNTIVPDLGKSWSWDSTKTTLTFQLEQGVKWHDGKPFNAKDVKCTFDLVSGLVKSEDFRKNPRKIWYHNVMEIKTNGDHEVSFVLKAPQPSFLALLASGYTPIYPCHVEQKQMRVNPVGTGPFKIGEIKRGDSVKLVRNPDYWKKGFPRLDGIEYRVISNRSTRVLAFIAGEVDLTFVSDITVAGLKDVEAKAPKSICQFVPSNNTINMIVNSSAPPFDNPKVRRAMALALDRAAFNKILAEGKSSIGAVMLPGPEGVWGMPPEKLALLPGYSPDRAKDLAEARKIMEELGYSAAKPLKVKVATRNIPLYRDPAVIFIDQMKAIYIEGELENVDTPLWHAKVTRKDYSVGLNTTGVGVDDPDVNMGRELHLRVGTQLHRLLQQRGRQSHLRSIAGDRPGEAQADPLGSRAQDRRGRSASDHPAQQGSDVLGSACEGRNESHQLALQLLAHGACLAG